MAQFTCSFRSLAHDLHTYEPLGKERSSWSRICKTSTTANTCHKIRCSVSWQHQRQGSSGWHRGFKKPGKQSIGISRGGRNTKIHLVSASDRIAVIFSLSAGQCHDAPQGRKLIEQMEAAEKCFLLMDRAYEDDLTRELSVKQGFTPVVPPKSNRKNPWDYDKEIYRRRNEVERLFRRIKHFRRVFTRYEKLDVMFIAFITVALIVDAIK